MIKEYQSKNTTIFVCTIMYELHVSAVSLLAIMRLKYNVRGTIYLL